MTTVNVRAHSALILLARVVGAASCAPPPPSALPGQDGGPRQTGGSRTGRTPRDLRADAKIVAGKEPTTTLIAKDGTKCVVTPERDRETNVGDEAWCVWQVP